VNVGICISGDNTLKNRRPPGQDSLSANQSPSHLNLHSSMHQASTDGFPANAGLFFKIFDFISIRQFGETECRRLYACEPGLYTTMVHAFERWTPEWAEERMSSKSRWCNCRSHTIVIITIGGESTLDLCYESSEEIPELQRPRRATAWKPQQSSMSRWFHIADKCNNNKSSATA